MEIIITSKKYGSHILLIEDEHKDIYEKYKWYLSKGKNTYYLHCRMQKNNIKYTILFHRVVTSASCDVVVDHKDGNGLNNKKDNLRIATVSENNRNIGTQKNNKSGYKGVIFYSKMDRYRVQIMKDRKKISGGYFDSPIEAAKKYNELAIKHHGEFARLNNI